MPTHEPATELVLTLGAADHGRLVSAEEFATACYDEPWKYERVNGRLVVMSPQGRRHARTNSPWRDRLGAYKLAHPDLVEEVVSEAWVRLGDNTDRIGDIGVYLVRDPRSLEIPDQAPDLMFEVVSRSATDRLRDYHEKRRDYYQIGVREYVIVDRFQNSVTVLTHASGGYEERTLGLADTYRSPLLPGFEVRLADVLTSEPTGS